MRVTVDGIDFVPAGNGSERSFGIGITTRNRPDLLASTLEAIAAHTPARVPVVVVDDGSDVAVSAPNAMVYRHDVALGIPGAKNRCIAELMALGVEHLFLFDDDTKPNTDGWWRPYVSSTEPHLQYSWTHFHSGKPVEKMTVLHADSRTVAYGWSMGCMLYVHRDVVCRVGGMREDFAPAMHEHIEWSQRIHNAGLTSWPFQDVPQSAELIYAADRFRTVQSSIALRDRREQLKRNDEILASYAGDASFVPYGTKDIILTCLFTSQPDPQRANRMPADPALANELLSTCSAIVLCDFDTDLPNFVKVEATANPYFQRWVSYRRYLLDHPEVRYVWCVDATDVKQLQNPFPMMQPGVLYCGWENQIVGCDWLYDNHRGSRAWIDDNLDRTLLNAGVVGADRQTMLTFMGRLLSAWAESQADTTDMACFNRAAYTMGPVTGPRITTLFKGNEHNTWSLFKHK